MKKKLRILVVWILVSLSFQFGGYSLLNNQIQKVMGVMGGESEPPITPQLKATIPGSDLMNIQVSYAKDYLAYSENGTLKIFNLKKGKVVFEKKSPSTTDKTLGVLTYQWLPDRSTLLYFYAKKNPNEITSVTIYPKATAQSPAQNSTPEKTEDPNQKIEKGVPKVVQPQPYTEKRYGNPQLTELYSLELPDSDDDDTPPDNRFNRTIDQLPKGGKLENLVFSTPSNLIYLTVKNGSSQLLMEIDIMKDVLTRNKSGEVISNMAASDRYGTLYVTSKIGDTHQVLALSGTKRWVISKKSNDRVIGIRAGKVYLGEVINNELVKIKTTSDRSELTDNPSLKTEWEGSIPFNEKVCALIGVNGQIVVYDNQTASIVTEGHLAEVKLQGDENYISVDGAELIQLTKAETSTLVELQPVKP
ncbi:hypothetical protein E4K67_04985 [Desulfosporosinus fructosivorans]|uniref:WD40 repeat domain-containing protein n=1 Tax=Desulfosporosinus fructosivorans TaxID=2018669 RepID=A0A4Z0R8S3_9FIRM|nr:hypothetical protein [Desulfosporosinus fructosivorans]TGE38834.1 hypothetical protein E4K67_04985 [Desulfosporosinus fructosivorans]